MDDHEILQHLLSLEREAAALVDDAQAEADRRLSEGEKHNRARYDESYAKEVEAMEASFTEKINLTKDNYREQLEAYRDSLKAVKTDTEGFSLLVEKLLFSKGP